MGDPLSMGEREHVKWEHRQTWSSRIGRKLERLYEPKQPPLDEEQGFGHAVPHSGLQSGASVSASNIKLTHDAPETDTSLPLRPHSCPSAGLEHSSLPRPSRPVISPQLASLNPPLEPTLSATGGEGCHLRGRRPGWYHNIESVAQSFHTMKPKLFYTIPQPNDTNKPQKCVVNLSAMQAYVLHCNQLELAHATRRELENDRSGERHQVDFTYLQGCLDRYCQSLRNIDYVNTKATEGFDNDAFLLQSSWRVEREIMRDAGLIPELQTIPGDLPEVVDVKHPILPRLRRSKIYAMQRHNKKVNFAFALGGRLALVVPMIIMTVVTGMISSLVTTSAFVLVFSAIVAGRVDLRPQEILGVTAAYAAVLVVFVGTNQSKSPTQAA